MRENSNFILMFLLFVLDTYGEQLFLHLYTLITCIPSQVFTTFCVVVTALILIYFSNKK